MCEKAASETPSFSPIIFTWYQSLVRGKELKKANQVRGVLVRGPVLLSVFEFGSKSLQVAQLESARVHCLRLRHPLRCGKRAVYATGTGGPLQFTVWYHVSVREGGYIREGRYIL